MPQSLGIAMELGEVLGEATVHSNLAASHEMLCSLDTALEHHNEVRAIDCAYNNNNTGALLMGWGL